MGFKILATIGGTARIQTCSQVRVADEGLLRFVARHCDTGASAILIDARLANYALDLIAVTYCIA